MKTCFSVILLITIFGCSPVDRRGRSANIPRRAGAVGQWGALKAGQRAGSYEIADGKVYCGEMTPCVEPMDGVDIASFQVIAGSDYARDESYVYYPLQITCFDGEKCGGCSCVEYKVEDADPDRFVYLGKDSAMDDESVYFWGRQLRGADPETFKVLKGGKYFYFAVDRSHVYCHEAVFKQADAASFFYDSLHPANKKSDFMPSYVVRDANRIWTFSPPNTFQEIEAN